MTDRVQSPRRFTGRMMAIIMLSFFGIVIGVNVFMGYLAVSTFSGTVVDNSYVASQHYNEWLEQAREQKKLGWTETVARDGDGIILTLTGPGGALGGAKIAGTARHPLGREPEQALTFQDMGAGRYRAAPIGAGRREVTYHIERDGAVKSSAVIIP